MIDAVIDHGMEYDSLVKHVQQAFSTDVARNHAMGNIRKFYGPDSLDESKPKPRQIMTLDQLKNYFQTIHFNEYVCAEYSVGRCDIALLQ